MRRSFYHFLMTLRGPNIKDPKIKFANDVSIDLQFPKQSEDYQDISHYLEMNANYVSTMDLFDEIWELYQETNQ